MLVALGACLFSEASWSLFSVPVPAQATVDGERTAFVSGTFNYDTSRVAAQIVSGIGFLGAGTIHKSGDAVFGLTTAASLWTTAAVGTHVGGPNQKDPYFLAPTFATVLIVVTLQALIHLENVVHMANRKRTGKAPTRILRLRGVSPPGSRRVRRCVLMSSPVPYSNTQSPPNHLRTAQPPTQVCGRSRRDRRGQSRQRRRLRRAQTHPPTPDPR